MTAAGPALIIPGTAKPTNCLGYNGLVADSMMTETYWAHLVEMHLFGTEVPSVYPDADGVTDYSTGDHAQNGNHAANNGATPGTSYFTSGSAAFYEMALTGDQLNTEGTTGQFTAYVIGKFPNINSLGIGPRNASTADGWSICRGGSPGRYTLEVFYAAGADPTAVTINTDADTGTVYEFLACTCRYDGSVQEGILYRIKPGGSLQTSSTMTLTGEVKGGDLIRVGRSVSANYTAAADIVEVGIFGKVFTGAELTTFRDQRKAHLLTLPTPIVI